CRNETRRAGADDDEVVASARSGVAPAGGVHVGEERSVVLIVGQDEGLVGGARRGGCRGCRPAGAPAPAPRPAPRPRLPACARRARRVITRVTASVAAKPSQVSACLAAPPDGVPAASWLTLVISEPR